MSVAFSSRARFDCTYSFLDTKLRRFNVHVCDRNVTLNVCVTTTYVQGWLWDMKYAAFTSRAAPKTNTSGERVARADFFKLPFRGPFRLGLLQICCVALSVHTLQGSDGASGSLRLTDGSAGRNGRRDDVRINEVGRRGGTRGQECDGGFQTLLCCSSRLSIVECRLTI